MDKEKKLIVLISLGIVFLITAILYFQPPFFSQWIVKIENTSYDQQVRRYYKPLSQHPSIAIVAVDDLSIEAEGRWPWDRSKIAQLTLELDRLGASVIAFDVIFSEPQINPVDAILQTVNDPTLAAQLEGAKRRLDADLIFADALQKGTAILGFAFTSNGKEGGVLPAPLLSLTKGQTEETLIPEMHGFIGNLPLFQQAAKRGGFLNTMIDADGIFRFSPLLLRQGEEVYSSLALQAAQTFLSLPFSGVNVSTSKGNLVIESVQVGDISIPTDPWGRILTPFRGAPYSFPYLSATALLQGKIERKEVEGKMIFIGLTATASSDLYATAISPVFPGVEIQATIASGIIDRYLPYKPNWGRGSAIALVLIIGLMAAFTFPYLGRIWSFFLSMLIVLAMQGVNYWFWKQYQVVLAFFFPMPTLIILFFLDFLIAYIGDRKEKEEIKKLFGRKAPPDVLEEIFRKKGEISLKGESKELTVLFADIWDFPAFSEPLSTEELQTFLDRYFTRANQIIFQEKGIVDKYFRDQIMALWNAPLSESEHAYLAVQAALKLQRTDQPVKVGIGINTGVVHVGDMGSKLHRSYTAIGPDVDLALHLKNLTKSYGVPILVGEATWRLTQDRIPYRKLDPIEWNGKQVPIFTPEI